MTEPLLHGRSAAGFGWIAHPEEVMQRSSTALVDGGRVWLIDPLRATGVDEQIRSLGTVVGVIVTFVGHDRDAAWFANAYGVPVFLPMHLPRFSLSAPVERIQRIEARIPDSPLQIVPCSGHGLLSWFRDTVVWWPAQRTMVIGDTLGTGPYFIRAGEIIAVHPVRRLQPPTDLLALRPERVYGGHGRSVTEGAAAAVEHAVRTARAQMWPAWGHLLRTIWEARRRRRR